VEVARIAAGLRELGVKPGDRVAGVLANTTEAIIAMLATTSLGAVWSSCSPDFGPSGIRDRLQQISPKVVFTTRYYFYHGKRIEAESGTRKAVEHLGAPVLTVDHVTHEDDWKSFGRREAKVNFAEQNFDDPLYIMFSSGTTGVPKCIVHGVGRTLLQHKKELIVHSDVKAGDRLLYFTTCGWMMWNWMVSTLSCGASLVLFDGSPSHPDVSLLWNICEKEQVTHFGTSPKFLSACLSGNLRLTQNLKSIRTILSTGSPLLEHQGAWVYQNLKDVHLASISGGTDILSCFMLGNPNDPVYGGEIQVPGLGMAVESWNENGEEVVGEKGELVCTKPFVSMPISFWNDDDGEKYRKAYFDKFPDVWCHGDFVEITERGTIVVFGRSDATLNPGGVRIGTAEIYRQVEQVSGVVDSLAISQVWDDDVRMVLFVKLSPTVAFSSELEQQIKNTLRRELTPRHVPQVILAVQDLPYTRSGKKMELAVAQIIRGEEVPNKLALANPECLAEFEAAATLLTKKT
jgi:acetoacetyl-CoA synthetase